jgi:dTDP-4-dehydrorhamnose 3,5-epimerase
MDRLVKILPTVIPDLAMVETSRHSDARGHFARLYCEIELRELIGDRRIMQINHSRTAAAGVVRGLHFQHPPHAEVKLVRCLKGRVWDVAVDLRRHSSTFLRWYGEELTPCNLRMLVIPQGFAHGFQTLEPNSELLYLHTASYAPDAEGGLRYDDPALGINWPLAVTELSARDASHQLIQADFEGLDL